jgi:hypothetical protein
VFKGLAMPVTGSTAPISIIAVSVRWSKFTTDFPSAILSSKKSIMTENTNLGLTVEAWADFIMDRWETKIERLKIGHSGNLAKSFYQHVQTQANGNPELIIFTFEYFGKFVDMGVGRGEK